MHERNFDKDSKDGSERLPNQFFGKFDTGVGGYTCTYSLDSTSATGHSTTSSDTRSV
jgi:hypothetical protein